MPWRPQYPGERPTLGYLALDWMVQNLAAPDREEYEPFYPTAEQAEFLLAFYEIDPVSGKRIVRRGVLSRPRGWGKSPFLSAVALLEGLGEVVPNGWDAQGRPVGMPWSKIRMPLVVVAAATEQQTQNAWIPLLEMCSDKAPAFDNYPGLEPMAGRVILPYGSIAPVPASSTSSKGFRPVFTIMDQTEQWNQANHGVDFANILVNNATKMGATVLESPNAYIPGEGSVAENTMMAWKAQQEGRTPLDRGLLVDHREAPADTIIMDEESMVKGLRIAYGDSSDHPDGCVLHDPPCHGGWAPIDHYLARSWDSDVPEQLIRSDFLNQITHATDSWLSQPEWNACRDRTKTVEDGDVITLGFDGSRGRSKGKPDATALVGCRVMDGHLFQIGLWEAADRKADWATWEPPMGEIEDTIDSTFKKYRVVGFYCDPARDWRSYVNAWEARYIRQLQVKASQAHPCEWWMLGGQSSKVEQTVEDMESAVRLGDLTHAGDDGLTRHVLNARRRLEHGKLKIDKESAASTRKIDAAIAACLAWRCRLDAVSKGFGRPRAAFKRPQRIY